MRSELINGKWSKDKLNILSRNVIRMITRVNEVSYFVATSILLQKVFRSLVSVIACASLSFRFRVCRR